MGQKWVKREELRVNTVGAKGRVGVSIGKVVELERVMAYITLCQLVCIQ